MSKAAPTDLPVEKLGAWLEQAVGEFCGLHTARKFAGGQSNPTFLLVTKAKDGSDRIRCGRRNLNVTDFLTQELHLPWREAAPILQRTYAEQQGREVQQPARSAPRRDLWADYRRTSGPRTICGHAGRHLGAPGARVATFGPEQAES